MDTDSLYVSKVLPDAPPLDTLVSLGKRLGSLKVIISLKTILGFYYFLL